MTPWVLVAYRVVVVATFAWVCTARPPEGEDPEAALSHEPGSTRILRTSPSCDTIIGYSGPNDCEIRLDDEDRIESIRLVRSGDTVEHADAVRADPKFFAQFVGRDAGNSASFASLDGVTRATLTSLAVIESVAQRLSGARPSLRFPRPIDLSEVRLILPESQALRSSGGEGFEILDARQGTIGTAIRTGPSNEAVVGYQGPTDTLLVFEHTKSAGSATEELVLRGMKLRRSYDNDKYVTYVREDPFFAEQFEGKSFESLAGMIPHDRVDTSGVDGVSGATMTSHAVAEGIARTATRMLAPPPPPRRASWLQIRGRDVGTLVAVLLAVLMTFTRLRGNRRLRIVTRIAIVGYLGILSGDMVSQGLLVGWVENGLPTRTAPGLIVLATVAFVIPVTTGRQSYCHQLCAFGALQELTRRAPWKRTMPRRAARLLRPAPAILLALVALALACGIADFPFSSVEPFGAWAWPLAGIATCTLAVVGLAASSFYSMSYCRVGCPTGALLDYVRKRHSSDRFRRRDLVALSILAIAITTRAWT